MKPKESLNAVPKDIGPVQQLKRLYLPAGQRQLRPKGIAKTKWKKGSTVGSLTFSPSRKIITERDRNSCQVTTIWSASTSENGRYLRYCSRGLSIHVSERFSLYVYDRLTYRELGARIGQNNVKEEDFGRAIRKNLELQSHGTACFSGSGRYKP